MTDYFTRDDVHASKVNPDHARLKKNKPKGRSLKKGPIIVILAGTGAILFIAFMIAMQDNSAVKDSDNKKEVAISSDRSIPDVIRSASDVPGTTISAPESDELFRDDPEAALEIPERKSLEPIPRYSSPRESEKKISDEEKAYEKALVAGVSFEKSSGGGRLPSAGPNSATSMLSDYADKIAEASKMGASPFGTADPNKQESKKDFIEDLGGQKETVSSMVKPPRSPYEVKAGTIIPASLISGLNSDLPGDVIAQVRESVFDTVSGNHLLIPQGSRLIGKYDSKVSYGQSRALVVWTRLIRPDGSSIRLENMSGTDLSGYAGFKDKVDNHFDRLIGGVFLSSVLSVGATMSGGDYDGSNDMSMDEVFAANAGEEINSAGEKITRKNLDVQPTIKIRPGFSVNVLVNKDMVIPPFRS